MTMLILFTEVLARWTLRTAWLICFSERNVVWSLHDGLQGASGCAVVV
jgi:hypothetical protein